MPRLDRYLLAQLMGLFGFFALVLVSIYWLNRAVLLFDQLISDGQSAMVVFEFTALSLPYVIRVVLPIAAFAATIYAINKLSSESELVVMQAIGASPWRLGRPVLMFGGDCRGDDDRLVHILEPGARARLSARQAQISENITAQFLNDGAFMHPSAGVTLYIREISARGELLDFFLSDARGDTATIYTAERALVVKTETGPKLLMFKGQAQNLDSKGRLSVTRFSDFTYDIGGLVPLLWRVNRACARCPRGSFWQAGRKPCARVQRAHRRNPHADGDAAARALCSVYRLFRTDDGEFFAFRDLAADRRGHWLADLGAVHRQLGRGAGDQAARLLAARLSALDPRDRDRCADDGWSVRTRRRKAVAPELTNEVAQ